MTLPLRNSHWSHPRTRTRRPSTVVPSATIPTRRSRRSCSDGRRCTERRAGRKRVASATRTSAASTRRWPHGSGPVQRAVIREVAHDRVEIVGVEGGEDRSREVDRDRGRLDHGGSPVREDLRCWPVPGAYAERAVSQWRGERGSPRADGRRVAQRRVEPDRLRRQRADHRGFDPVAGPQLQRGHLVFAAWP